MWRDRTVSSAGWRAARLKGGCWRGQRQQQHGGGAAGKQRDIQQPVGQALTDPPTHHHTRNRRPYRKHRQAEERRTEPDHFQGRGRMMPRLPPRPACRPVLSGIRPPRPPSSARTSCVVLTLTSCRDTSSSISQARVSASAGVLTCSVNVATIMAVCGTATSMTTTAIAAEAGTNHPDMLAHRRVSSTSMAGWCVGCLKGGF